MPIELSKGRWSVETIQGRTLFRIDETGINVQVIVDLPTGRCNVKDEILVPFSKVEDLAVGQAQMI